MNRYENGKIYFITDLNYTKFYYGSTCESLTKRFGRHKDNYRRCVENDKTYRMSNTSSFNLFHEFGVNNCKIELVCRYPCNTKEELLAKEGQYIRENTCVNKNIAGRTQQDYINEHRDRINERNRNYHQNNKDKVSQIQHKKYMKNSEYYKQKARKNHEDQKDQIHERKNTVIVCGCGRPTTNSNIRRHEKTNYHQNWLKQQEPEQEPLQPSD